MAKSANRDVKLSLIVEALGQDNIAKLESALRDLGQTGGKSGQEFTQLADEVVRLGEQTAALQTVKSLSEETDTLRERQERAAATAQQLSERLDALRAATDVARDAEAKARAEYEAADLAKVRTTNALRELRAAYDATGKGTSEYRSKLQALVAEDSKAAENKKLLANELGRATAALNEASGAQKKAETQARNANKASDSLTESLRKQEVVLRQAASSAAALGVNTENLAAAETSLLAAFGKVASTADQRNAAIKEMADADRLAAIEAEALAALYAKGEAALRAELMAQRDAAKAVRDYAAAKAQAAADADAWQREADGIVAMRLAQEKSTRSTEEMVRKLRELDAQKAFAKKAAEAQELVRASEYARFWADALDEVDRKNAEVEASTKRVTDAFAKINSRSIEDVKAEIQSTRAAMDTLANSGKLTGGALAVAMAQGESRIKALQREVRELSGTLTVADKAAGLLKNSMGQIAAGNLIADGIGALINKVKELGMAFVTTIAAQERLSRALNAIYKDTSVTRQQMDFLRASAVASGVSVADLSANFVKFSAATKSAGIPLSVTNDLFLSTARAAGTLGLSGEQVGGMLEALAQMASKGTVSMEELRQQLGDRLPGALSMVAQGLGLTEAELIKLVESGQLAARDMFPALAKSLKTMHGEVGGLNTTWQNFKNVLTGVAQDAGDAGWTQILTGGLKVLGGAVGVLGLGFSTLWEAMRLTGVAAVALAATLKGEGLEAWGYFNEQVQVSIDRLAQQNDRLSAMLDPSSEAADRVRSLAVAQDQLSGSTNKATSDIQKQPAAVASVAKSIEYMNDVTKILGDSQKDLSAKIVQLNSLSAKRVEALEKESVAADKQARAADIQGKAMVTLAQLRDSDIAMLQAQQQATENSYAAASKAAEAQRAVTEVLELQRQTLVELAAQEATGLEGRKAEIEAIDKKLVQSRAETEQAQAAADALRQEAAARTLAVQKLQDNSARLDEFRQAASDAEAAVIGYKEALDKGWGSQEELTRLQEQAAAAMGLYRDAISDAAERAQALNSVEQAKISLMTSGLSVQQQAYQQLAAAARAHGDLTQATYYEVEAKRVQIKVTQLTAEAKRLEAQATIKAIEAEKDELAYNGKLTEAKKLELEARLLNAKAKQVEAGASASIVRALEEEIRAIQQGTTSRNATIRAVQQHSDALEELYMNYKLTADYSEQQIALLQREAEAAERAAEAYRKKWNVDKEGFTLDKNGNRMTMSVPTETYAYDTAKGQGLSDEQALKIVDQFWQNGKPLFNQAMSRAGMDWFSQVNDAVTKERMNSVRSGANSTSPTTTGTTETTATSGGSRTVNVNIGGQRRKINVASQSDSDALVAVLRQLEAQGGTAA